MSLLKVITTDQKPNVMNAKIIPLNQVCFMVFAKIAPLSE